MPETTARARVPVTDPIVSKSVPPVAVTPVTFNAVAIAAGVSKAENVTALVDPPLTLREILVELIGNIKAKLPVVGTTSACAAVN